MPSRRRRQKPKKVGSSALAEVLHRRYCSCGARTLQPELRDLRPLGRPLFSVTCRALLRQQQCCGRVVLSVIWYWPHMRLLRAAGASAARPARCNACLAPKAGCKSTLVVFAQAAKALQPIEEAPLNLDPNCYEGERNLNITRNKERFAAIGLTDLAAQVRARSPLTSFSSVDARLRRGGRTFCEPSADKHSTYACALLACSPRSVAHACTHNAAMRT